MSRETNAYVNEQLAKSPNKRGWYWQRRGKCDPVKCRDACCRFSVATITEDDFDYVQMVRSKSRDFSVCELNDKEVIVTPNHCPKLGIFGGCKIHGAKEQPTVCKYFPMSPTDGVYHLVKEKCGYTFFKVRSRHKRTNSKEEVETT